jgi:hypothetical protein
MVTGKITDTTGKIENDTGKITGKIIEDTGKINQDTGKIELSEDFSGNNAGKIPEITEESEIARYRGQRGPDKKKRNFPAQTLKNLPQFRDKPHEEVRQYILETRGIDIGGSVNWNKTMMWVLIGLAIVVGGIGVWKLWQQR